MNSTSFHGTWTLGYDFSRCQTEFATANRVPFLVTPHPSRHYLTGIIVDDPLYGGLVPTDEEVVAVAAFATARLDEWLPKPNDYREEMERFAPYDIVPPSLPTFYFIKYVEGGWACHAGGQQGPEFVPYRWQPDETIHQVIERVNKR